MREICSQRRNRPVDKYCPVSIVITTLLIFSACMDLAGQVTPAEAKSSQSPAGREALAAPPGFAQEHLLLFLQPRYTLHLETEFVTRGSNDDNKLSAKKKPDAVPGLPANGVQASTPVSTSTGYQALPFAPKPANQYMAVPTPQSNGNASAGNSIRSNSSLPGTGSSSGFKTEASVNAVQASTPVSASTGYQALPFATNQYVALPITQSNGNASAGAGGNSANNNNNANAQYDALPGSNTGNQTLPVAPKPASQRGVAVLPGSNGNVPAVNNSASNANNDRALSNNQQQGYQVMPGPPLGGSSGYQNLPLSPKPAGQHDVAVLPGSNGNVPAVNNSGSNANNSRIPSNNQQQGYQVMPGPPLGGSSGYQNLPLSPKPAGQHDVAVLPGSNGNVPAVNNSGSNANNNNAGVPAANNNSYESASGAINNRNNQNDVVPPELKPPSQYNVVKMPGANGTVPAGSNNSNNNGGVSAANNNNGYESTSGAINNRNNQNDVVPPESKPPSQYNVVKMPGANGTVPAGSNNSNNNGGVSVANNNNGYESTSGAINNNRHNQYDVVPPVSKTGYQNLPLGPKPASQYNVVKMPGANGTVPAGSNNSNNNGGVSAANNNNGYESTSGAINNRNNQNDVVPPESKPASLNNVVKMPGANGTVPASTSSSSGFKTESSVNNNSQAPLPGSNVSLPDPIRQGSSASSASSSSGFKTESSVNSNSQAPLPGSNVSLPDPIRQGNSASSASGSSGFKTESSVNNNSQAPLPGSNVSLPDPIRQGSAAPAGSPLNSNRNSASSASSSSGFKTESSVSSNGQAPLPGSNVSLPDPIRQGSAPPAGELLNSNRNTARTSEPPGYQSVPAAKPANNGYEPASGPVNSRGSEPGEGAVPKANTRVPAKKIPVKTEAQLAAERAKADYIKSQAVKPKQ